MASVRHVDDTSVADWVAAGLRPWGGTSGGEVAVASVVPTGFDSVVRVLHPAGDGRTWAQVAAASGRTMHALAQWCGIFPAFDGASRSSDVDPAEGSVPGPTLVAILDHCPSEGDLTYAVWCGFGTWRLPDEPPTTQVGRECFLFRGSKEAITTWPGMEPSWEQSANVIWPASRSWCIATEIDWDSTLVAGPRWVADGLLADPRLEAFDVSYDDDLSWLGDTVNPTPDWLVRPG